VFRRDGWQCVRCPSRVNLQPHHMVYRDRFEDSVAAELITLCRSCHEREHGLQKVVEFKADGVTGRIGNRRWNELGQRVAANGRAYGQHNQKVSKTMSQALRQARKRTRRNWSC